MRAVSTTIAGTMCKAIIEGGFLGLHFYVLNQEEIFYKVLKELGLFVEGGDAAPPAAAGGSGGGAGAAATAV